jgi:hypothetical protein
MFSWQKIKGVILVIGIIFAAGCTADLRDDDTLTGKIINGFEGEPVVPRNANRLFIAQPVNMTGITDLSSKLLYRVKAHISLDGRLGVDPDEQKSDLRLEVIISKFMVQSLAHDSIGRAVQKRIRVTVDARLLNLKRNKVIFFEAGIQAFRIFSDLAPPIETVPQVTEYVLDDLAKRITSKTVTGWYTEQMTEIEKGKSGADQRRTAP